MPEIDPQPEPDISPAESADQCFSAADLSADRRAVDCLFRAGVIDDDGRQAALRIIAGPVLWWPWIDRALLFLGLTFSLVGVICFFAWNWGDLPGAAKLGLIQCGLAVCCGLAWWKGLETTAGRAAVLAASVFVGVFLAVFGQVYQTGADDWLLFAGWAGLILPWTLLARFEALWILWLGIVNVALVTCWMQTLSRDVDWQFFMLTLGLVNGVALGLKEQGQHRGLDWLQSDWSRHLLAVAMLVPLTCPVLALVLKTDLFGSDWLTTLLLTAVVLAGTLCVTYHHFRHRSPDLVVLTFVAICICTVATLIIGRLLVKVIDDFVVVVLIGGVILATVTIAARWLLNVARALRAASDQEASA